MSTETAVLTGTVARFDNKKGWGFIDSPGRADVFVHYSGILGEGYRKLEEGQFVAFEIRESSVKVGKVEAVNVRVIA